MSFNSTFNEFPGYGIEPDVAGYEDHAVRFDGLGEDGEGSWCVGGLDFGYCLVCHDGYQTEEVNLLAELK